MTIAYLVVAASLTLAVSSLQAATSSWVRIQHPALVGGGSNVYVRDLVAGTADEPWLAVGYLVESDGTRIPSAWTSPDAVSWSRTTMAPTASPERRDGPYLVARRGAVAVAVGERFDNQVRSAAWYRPAGGAWIALTDPLDPLVSFRGRIRALDAGPEGFVAVGVDASFGRAVAYVFTSVDGQRWTVHAGIDPPDGFVPWAVSESTNGNTVLVGATGSGPLDGRIWVLDATGEWTRVSPEPLGLDGAGAQVVTSVDWSAARGFVAGGLIVRGGREFPTLWKSSDGLVWTKLPDSTPPHDGLDTAIQRIVAVGGGFVASGASNAGPRIWQSSDGTSWSAIAPPQVPTDEGSFVFADARGGNLLVGTLSETGSQLHRRTGSGWVRADVGPAFPRGQTASELVDVAAAGPRVIAVGEGADQRSLVMVSSSGGAWQRRAFGDRAGRLLAIAANRGTFQAAGWRLVDGRARLAVWTSKDGRRWRRAGGTAREPVGAFIDIAPLRDGFVAVALEPSARGFVTSVWSLTRSGWRDESVLGPGEPQAVCVGPHGVTAVATRGSGVQSRIVAWTRKLSGRWPREPDLVAGASFALGCADAPSGTVIAGQNGGLAAAVWRRARPTEAWRAVTLAQTDPASFVGDVVRDGAGFLATGAYGGRGQVDLAAWRSSDGVTWSWLSGTDPVFTEPGYQSGLGIERAGQRLVVVGRHGAGSAGLWVGSLP